MRRLHHIFASENGPDTRALTVTSLGHFKRENFFRFPEGRPAWVFVYFETSVTVELSGGRKRVPAHTAVLFPPRRPLFYGHDDGFRQYWICARGSMIAGWVKRYAVPVEVPIACKSAGFFAEALHRIDEELTGHEQPHPALLSNLLENLVIELSRKARPEPEPAIDRRLLAARRFIETHFPETLRLKDIAAVAGLSPFRFSREFHAAFGAAPVEMLIRVRLSAAREKLLTTDADIGDIANDVGIPDPVHFSKLFTRHVGRSPQAFRRGKKTPAGA